MHKLLAALVSAVVLLSAPTAFAFPFLASWITPSATPRGVTPQQRAGAGGIYGTGSAKDRGILCAHCHIKGAGTIDASVTPAPAWPQLGGMNSYSPGATYTITVKLLNEHNLPKVNTPNDNLNGFALTAETQSGVTAGSFTTDTNPVISSASCMTTAPAMTPATGTTYLLDPSGKCSFVVYIPRPNTTSWTFNWTAPAKGSGPVTLYYGVVDGDHDGSSSLGDDVKQGTIKLVEGP